MNNANTMSEHKCTWCRAVDEKLIVNCRPRRWHRACEYCETGAPEQYTVIVSRISLLTETLRTVGTYADLREALAAARSELLTNLQPGEQVSVSTDIYGENVIIQNTPRGESYAEFAIAKSRNPILTFESWLADE
jgi:hypothetical protein